MTVSMVNDFKQDNRAAALRVLDEFEQPEYDCTGQDEERARRRRERIMEMKRQKERQLFWRRLAVPALLVCMLCIALAAGAVRLVLSRHQSSVLGKENGNEELLAENTLETETKGEEETKTEKSGKGQALRLEEGVNLACADITTPFLGMLAEQTVFIEENRIFTLGGKNKEPVLAAQSDESTLGLVGDAVSENVVFIDVEAGRILAQKDAKVRISPASMTKILTVLVAAEHITDADDTFEITREITDYSYSNGCTSAGFEVGECVTVNDLFYGTILPSGGEAAVGLATYVAGSHEAFVELMNEKLEELGLSETSHCTNCVGLYNAEHYSTVYDMAVILKAAYDNEYCREVLSSHIYTTSSTTEHPDGITLSNLFLRRIEDKDTHGEVLCAKTGFVTQSRNCAASLSVGNDGKLYICVTAQSTSPWRCIYDHVAFYQYFLS